MPAVRSRSVSTHSGPPSGVQVSSRPVSSPSTVRSSGSLARTRLSGRLVSGPSGVQPAGVCPPVAASRPAAAGWSRWGTPGYGGAAVTAGSSRVACGPASSPAAQSTAGPRRLGCGHRCGGRVEAGRGASAADWPGDGWAGGCTRPTRQGRTTTRAPCRWRLRSGRGVGWRDVAARHRVGGHLGAGAATTVRGRCGALKCEWTGLEGPMSLAARMAAAPVRPRQVVGATGSTPATL
jgi:hypothetical protein